MATAPAAIHAGGSASVGSSGWKVQRRNTIVITMRYSTRPRVNAARHTNASASLSVRPSSSAPSTAIDSVDTVRRNQVPLMPAPRPGLSTRRTTAMSVV